MRSTTYFSDMPRWGMSSLGVSAGERDLLALNYLLLAAGFFTGVTPILAAALALWLRRSASAVARDHYAWQLRIALLGLVTWVAFGLAHLVIAGLAAVTFGLAAVLMVVPWAGIAVWAVWTVWALARGGLALRRGVGIA